MAALRGREMKEGMLVELFPKSARFSKPMVDPDMRVIYSVISVNTRYKDYAMSRSCILVVMQSQRTTGKIYRYYPSSNSEVMWSDRPFLIQQKSKDALKVKEEVAYEVKEDPIPNNPPEKKPRLRLAFNLAGYFCR